MQVREIMSTQVQRIHQTASIQEAAEQMKTLDVGMVPVFSGDRLVGTLTDRDIAVRAVAQRCAPAGTQVAEVMTPGVAYCFEDQDIATAGNIMAKKQIRRLIVLNRNKRMVGIVSLGDLAQCSEANQAAADTLQSVSKPGS